MKARLTAGDWLVVVVLVISANVLLVLFGPVVVAHAQEARAPVAAVGTAMKPGDRTVATNGREIVVIDFEGRVVRREIFNP